MYVPAARDPKNPIFVGPDIKVVLPESYKKKEKLPAAAFAPVPGDAIIFPVEIEPQDGCVVAVTVGAAAAGNNNGVVDVVETPQASVARM